LHHTEAAGGILRKHGECDALGLAAYIRGMATSGIPLSELYGAGGQSDNILVPDSVSGVLGAIFGNSQR